MGDAQQDFISEHDARIDETHDIRTALVSDLNELADPVNKNHQGARRAFVRGVFSLIEAMTFRMKASALAIGRGKLESSEVLLLEEREFALEDNGALREKSPKPPTRSRALLRSQRRAQALGGPDRRVIHPITTSCGPPLRPCL